MNNISNTSQKKALFDSLTQRSSLLKTVRETQKLSEQPLSPLIQSNTFDCISKALDTAEKENNISKSIIIKTHAATEIEYLNVLEKYNENIIEKKLNETNLKSLKVNPSNMPIFDQLCDYYF